jgi:hypothetical protein
MKSGSVLYMADQYLHIQIDSLAATNLLASSMHTYWNGTDISTSINSSILYYKHRLASNLISDDYHNQNN